MGKPRRRPWASACGLQVASAAPAAARCWAVLRAAALHFLCVEVLQAEGEHCETAAGADCAEGQDIAESGLCRGQPTSLLQRGLAVELPPTAWGAAGQPGPISALPSAGTGDGSNASAGASRPKYEPRAPHAAAQRGPVSALSSADSGGRANASAGASRADTRASSSGSCFSEESLVFLHIPKNAGTTVENLGHLAGARWGRFMDFSGCSGGGTQCPDWHVPPWEMGSPNMYEGRDVFCVSRDPYERAISEYSYAVGNPHQYAGEFVWEAQMQACSAKGMNRFLRLALMRYMQGPVSSTGRYLLNCHLLPQSKFVWSPDGTQNCKHILRLENFSSEFTELMLQKNYSSVLDQSIATTNEGGCEGLLGVDDLDAEAVSLINLVYAEDFRRLRYEPRASERVPSQARRSRARTHKRPPLWAPLAALVALASGARE